MFQEKCLNLEQALDSANVVSADEIKALRRNVTLLQEQNSNLTASYDDLKKEHESMIFAKDSVMEKVTREHTK